MESKYQYCARCKRDNPGYECGHCFKIAYCCRQCQNEHYPVHFGQIHHTQLLMFPIDEHLLIQRTHYHDDGGGIVPYKLSTIRKLVEQTKGDLNVFDAAIFSYVTGVKDSLKTFKNKTFDPIDSFSFPISDINFLTIPFLPNKTIQELTPLFKIIEQKTYDTHEEKKELFQLVINELLKNESNFDSYFGNLLYVLQVNEVYDKWEIIQTMFSSAFKSIIKRYDHDKLNYGFKYVNNLKSIKIPRGTYLYRGFGSDRNGNGLSASRKHDYFGFSYPTTPSYQTSRKETDTVGGWLQQKIGVSVFKTNKHIKVLDLTDPDTVLYLQTKIADPEILDAFKSGWQIRVKKGKKVVKRSSGSGATDDITVNWLCENKYDGYIGYDDASSFHDELVLCNAQAVLDLQFIKYHNKDFKHDFNTDSFSKNAIANDF